MVIELVMVAVLIALQRSWRYFESRQGIHSLLSRSADERAKQMEGRVVIGGKAPRMKLDLPQFSLKSFTENIEKGNRRAAEKEVELETESRLRQEGRGGCERGQTRHRSLSHFNWVMIVFLEVPH